MRLKGLATIVIGIFLFLVSVSAALAESSPMIFFYGTGCPHCAIVEKYIEKENLDKRFSIEKREIYFNRDNAVLFNNLLDRLGIASENRGVPAVVYGDRVVIGDAPIIEFLQNLSEEVVPAESRQPGPISTEIKTQQQTPDLTLLAVVVGSLVDAINPCEFAVLIILMTTILATGNAGKAFISGLAFSVSVFISYFLMGLGLYKALGVGGISGWFYKFIGWLAIVLGLLNLKDWLWYGKGFLMEVPISWRPKLKSLIGSVTCPKGAFAIGFLVSLFLLPCTSGPYIVILGMLAKRVFDTKAILYLILYNLIFVSPMVLISWLVYRGFNPAKAEEIRQKRLRVLHLVAGVVMFAMGIVIVRGWI
jgi:cytochrome c biogenesis protein CcdA/glutaredoxin